MVQYYYYQSPSWGPGPTLAEKDYWKVKIQPPDDNVSEQDNEDSLPADRHSAIESRRQRGLLIYGDCSQEELRQFCGERGIRLLRSSNNRAGMIASLELADDKGTTFDRFLDLPAELRLRIYQSYKASLGSKFGPFSVAPPITSVSKMTRQEAASRPRLDEVAGLFFEKAPLVFLEQVRRLQVWTLLPAPPGAKFAGTGYTEWLIDLRAKSREKRVIFEDMGTFWRPGQTRSELDGIVQAVQEQVRDVVDNIAARDRLRLCREDANTIFAAFTTFPRDTTEV
ncbi:hypothetical protein CB0940_11094 [Cercospora beticola]|uniref:Uncharacterized protein n=1 Tax=Cercospora beticola TaxID=122368 RepID=A0A2G5HEM3_CERBT|nr:hypothetical protein CB0940_11094 [Cercospora beticola]PIA90968.1 hypothetical protein CB0940_11094 [Cercospora beticola]WPB07924.1 hypothetical protein RHO25_012588 [Cercospora beticola]